MTPDALVGLATVGLVAATVIGARAPRAWLALIAIGTGANLIAAVGVLATGIEWEWRSAFAIGGETIHLRLDAISALFLALVSIVGAAGATYSREYWPD